MQSYDERSQECLDRLNDLAVVVYKHNAAKGFWGESWDEDRNVGEALALMHSELSEALEEIRKTDATVTRIYSEGGKPEGFPVELADCVIRILDFCGRYGIPLAEAIEMKLAYNQTRPHKHGREF